MPPKFQREGIRCADLSDADKESWDLEWGEEDPPDEVSGEAINKWLFNTDTVDQMRTVLMTKGHRFARG